MEDHPSEEVEETKKVESIDEEKEVVESDREISIDGNSVSVNGRHEAEYIEKIPPILDPEKFEEFIGSVVDSVQPAVSFTEDLSHGVEALVEKWEDPNVTEVESKDFEDKITPPLDVTDGVTPVIEDVTLNGNEETQSPSSYETNGLLAAVTDVETSGTEESIPPSLDKKTGITPVAIDVVSNGIEETTLPS
ncbi:hypothetical protein CFOL_v3_08687 [Cephalotus follicularis]|uniref:Uncharacterized protein n=1 Tax=Cephalotus follicularis TaxID=3775 RepID=A0A1Q3BBI6_CEPFO|nr:hypothetical protein CFOL_v3_08687 [Cephalotus follicularis]